MSKRKRITLKVDEDFHRAVRVKAATLDVTISDVVRGLLQLWLEGTVELKP